MARKAFALGVGAFVHPEIPPLHSAARDAEDMFAQLTSPRFGAADKVGSQLLIDANRQEIVSGLHDFFSSLSENDHFILFFAGHGIQLKSGWAFYPRDGNPRRKALTAFTMKDLHSILNNSRSAKGIIIIDSCYAAEKEVEGYTSRDDPDAVPQAPEVHEGTVSIWSCSPFQKSFEGAKNGIFTRLFLDALNVGADLGRNRETIRAHDIVNFIANRLRQNPDLPQNMPICQESGDTEALYLSRNPYYLEARERTRMGRRADANDRVAQIVHIGEAIAENPSLLRPPAGRSREEALLRIKYFPPDDCEVCYLPLRKRRMVLLVLIEAAVIACVEFTLTAFFIFSTKSDVNDKTMFIFFLVAPILLGLLWIGFDIIWFYRFWKAPPYFLVITTHGFYCHLPRETVAVDWDSIESITIPKSHLLLRLSVGLKAGSSIYDTRSASAKGTSFDFGILNLGAAFADSQQIRRAIDWGRSPRSFVPNVRTAQTVTDVGGSVHIVLVGVGDYERLPKLRGPAADVAAMKKLLARQTNRAEPGHITISIDPSPAQLDESLAGAFNKARGQSLLLYFSGHGLVSRDDLFLALVKAERADISESIPVFRLLNLKVEYGIQDLVLILDCCFSGAGGASLGLSLRKSQEFLSLLQDRDRNGLTVFAASGGTEEAFASQRGSVFTKCLVEEAEKLLSKEDEVRLDRLYQSVSKRLEETGLGQCVQFFASNRGNSIALVRTDREVRISEAIDAARVRRIQKDSRELEAVGHGPIEKLSSYVDRLIPWSRNRLWKRLAWALNATVVLCGIAMVYYLFDKSLDDEYKWKFCVYLEVVLLALRGFVALLARKFGPHRLDPIALAITDVGVVFKQRSCTTILARDEIIDVQEQCSQETHKGQRSRWIEIVATRDRTIPLLGDGKYSHAPRWRHKYSTFALKADLRAAISNYRKDIENEERQIRMSFST